MLPFGAIKAYGSLAEIVGSEVALRAMVTGVDHDLWYRSLNLARGGGHCHVLLPLSPNHGIFGGDGLYAEAKAPEVLLNKCQSEQDQWQSTSVSVERSLAGFGALV